MTALMRRGRESDVLHACLGWEGSLRCSNEEFLRYFVVLVVMSSLELGTLI
jgi:hypothetical protein